MAVLACKHITALLVIYLFQDDDEARCRWQTVSHNYICRQETQTQSLVEQEQRGEQQTVQPGVTAGLGLWPQVEQGVGNQQHRQEHADPRAHHQRDLSERIDQQVKVQHQPGDREMEQR